MEISTISVGRMNNGAHYLYNVDFIAVSMPIRQ